VGESPREKTIFQDGSGAARRGAARRGACGPVNCRRKARKTPHQPDPELYGFVS